MDVVRTSSATEATTPSVDLSTAGGFVATNWHGSGTATTSGFIPSLYPFTLTGDINLEMGSPNTMVCVIASVVISQPLDVDFDTPQAWSPDVPTPGLTITAGGNSMLIDAFPVYNEMQGSNGILQIGFNGCWAFMPSGALTINVSFILGMSTGVTDSLPEAYWDGTIATFLGFQ